MTIQYKYDDEHNHVIVTPTCSISSTEIYEYFNQLIHDSSIKSKFLEIVDFNNVEDFILKYSDLEKLEEASKLLVEKGHKTTLICAYSKRSQEIAKMMMPLFQSVKLNLILCQSESKFEMNLRAITGQRTESNQRVTENC